MTRAIVVTVQGQITEQQLSTPPTLEELQNLVGGDVECVPTRVGDTMYLNEEGKLQNPPLPINQVATSLTRGIVADDDMIVGNVVLLGDVDEEGYDTDARSTLDQIRQVATF